MMKTHGKTIRSIDVGYGHVKYVLSHSYGSTINCASFPAVAPQISKAPEIGGSFMTRRNTVTIKLGESLYEVGKDASLATGANYTREQDTRYALSEAHMAFVRGALFYMGCETIDMLVLGLPVSTINEHADPLISRMKGLHIIPNPIKGDDQPDTIEVSVKNVMVVPQPLGAYYDYVIRKNIMSPMRARRTLIIDPGYFTLDWVVADGMQMVPERSNGLNDGGVKSIIDKIQSEISARLKVTLGHDDSVAIERALREGTNPRFFGKELELEEFMEGAKALMRQHVAAIAAKVGVGTNIDQIILAGGGAELFRESVQDKFPRHEILTTDDPVFANVRGFQYLGTEWAIRKEVLK